MKNKCEKLFINQCVRHVYIIQRNIISVLDINELVYVHYFLSLIYLLQVEISDNPSYEVCPP